MAAHPNLNIPDSGNTVKVRVIDTGARATLPFSMVTPTIKGFETLKDFPAFSFLIEHPSGRKILFDLGIRKDWNNYAGPITDAFRERGWIVTTEKGVEEVLEEHGVRRGEIEAIVWSHWHWDHLGNPAVFEPSTSLLVGQGFKDFFMPGYPANPRMPVLESDFAGREVKEILFEESRCLKIGRFDAMDYFGDGSFYILDAPGHALGHLNALARVTASPPSFIFMGADTAHHPGEFRPTTYSPLPPYIDPNPLDMGSSYPCPGALFEHLLRDGDKTQPFYRLSRPHIPFSDVDVAEQTLEKMQETDSHPQIFTVIAHDKSLLGKIDFFPGYVNDFVAKDWVQKTKWAFLSDFRNALISQDLD